MTEYAKKLLRLYHEQGKKDRMIEGSPPLSFTSGSPGNLKNYRIFGNSVEQVISNNLFYKVISGAGMQTDGTIKSDSSYNMLFAKIIPGQDYIAAKGEVNSTALTYTLYNVYDHDPDIGSQALLPSWKSTNNNGIINYTGDTPVYLGLRVSASIAFPHLNIGTTICDYDEYEASITGVGNKVTDSQDEHYDQYRVPVTVEGKNLVPNTATSQTINGVAFTVNSDGSVTCNGTATQTVMYILNDTASLAPGTYKLTGCPAGGWYVDKYKLDIVAPPTSYGTDVGNGSSFTLSSTLTNAQYRIIIYAGQTCNNLTFYPMVRKADIEDDTYEPYRTPVTTPIYLPEQIRKVGDEAEYIDYGEQKQHFADGTSVDVELPALPTLSGTNTLSVGTEVQPSKVEIKGKIKAV